MTRRAAVVVVVALLAGCDPVVPELVFSLADGEFWPDTTGYPGVGEGRVLVTNNLDDTVSVLDLALIEEGRAEVIAQVPVGLVPVEREGPHHVAAAPDGEHYFVGISNYVAGGAGGGPHGVHGRGDADGRAVKMRARDNVKVAEVRVDRSPGDVRVTPDGRRLLVSHFDVLKIEEAFTGGDPDDVDARLAVIDPETMGRPTFVTLCPGAHGIAIAPDSSRAYVSCLSDELAVVELEHLTVTRVPVLAEPGTVAAPRCYPYAVTLSPDGGSAWVSCYQSGQVLRYDVAAGAMDAVGEVVVDGPAAFGAFTADGSTLVVPYQGVSGEGGLAFVDVAVPAITEARSLFAAGCEYPHVARFTDDEQQLMVVCEGDHYAPGSFLVVDVASRDVLATVPLGVFPDDIAVLR